jgi:hypothetical protein
MKKYILMASVFILLPTAISASMLSSIVTGKILLDVENSGEAWYVEPDSYERHFLNRPADAFEIMRELGLGITTADLEKIPAQGEYYDGDKSLRDRLSGKILIQVEASGEAWYVYPGDLKRYYLGRPADAFEIMSDLGLGITSSNLLQIPIAGEDSVQAVSTSGYTYVTDTLSTDRGEFSVQYVKLERDQFTMITDTSELTDCEGDCDAKYLEEFVQENNALIGIHGTYFCPPDYSSCSSQVNAFDPPVYNTDTGFMLNEFDLPHHDGPMIVVDDNGQYYYYNRATDFGSSVAEWEQEHGAQLQAAMAHYPSLIESGQNIVSTEVLQTSMHSSATRAGIGYDDTYVYLVITTSASVTDLASVFDALGVDYAMNLDGGASIALYADGSYLYGPSRQNPNVILFEQK